MALLKSKVRSCLPEFVLCLAIGARSQQRLDDMQVPLPRSFDQRSPTKAIGRQREVLE